VLLEQVLAVLAPQPGEVAVDCTLGFGGHAAYLLQRLGVTGRLLGLDCDAAHLDRAREAIAATGLTATTHHSNFAALPTILAQENLEGADLILADLGMSSMQVDDPERGFALGRASPSLVYSTVYSTIHSEPIWNLGSGTTMPAWGETVLRGDY
jgi:16S rRNA (cytosine1402-N4)-methyltransferase